MGAKVSGKIDIDDFEILVMAHAAIASAVSISR